MKIVRLETENVKRIRAVDITPGDSNMVVIGGRNAQGKSSLLDSIEMALGGAGSVPQRPVRSGEDGAHVTVDLGDIVVTREFSANGESRLKVESKDGAVYKSPQTMLDALVGKLSFDPLAFTRLDEKQQHGVLCKLVKLDLGALDTQRAELYAERTQVNRQAKAAAQRAADMPVHEMSETAEISVAELSSQLQAARKLEREAAEKQAQSERAGVAAVDLVERIEATEAEIRDLNNAIELAQKKVADLRDRVGIETSASNSLLAAAERLKAEVPDVAAIHARIQSAEAINSRLRANTAKTEARREALRIETAVKELGKRIAGIDEQKATAIAAASFPVAGLSVNGDGVLFNNVPLDQASSAERLRVSVAIGLAMNPKLRVLLVRDGSLLDDDGLRMLGTVAAENDAQLWVEKVSGDGAGCSVVIEDGSVKVTKAEAAE